MISRIQDRRVVIDSFDVRNEWEVQEFKAEWADFVASRFPSYFYRNHAWSHSWWQAYARGEQTQIHLLRDKGSGSLVGIIPLWIERSLFSGFSVRRLELLGRGLGFEDFLIDPEYVEYAGEALADILKGMKWDIARFSNLGFEATTKKLASVASDCGFRVEATVSPWQGIPTKGRFEDYLKSRSRKFRKSCRLARNRSQDLGELAFERYELEAVPPEKFETARSIAEQSWQYQEGGSHFCRRAQRSLIDALRNPIDDLSSQCELWFLKIGETDVALLFGVVSGSRYEAIEIAHLEQYARCSPGKLLMLHVIGQKFENPQIEHLNLGSGGGYKGSFTDQTLSVDNLVLFRNSLYGKLISIFRQTAAYEVLRRLGKSKPGDGKRLPRLSDS